MKRVLILLACLTSLMASAQKPTISFKSDSLPVDSLTFNTEVVQDGLYNVYASSAAWQMLIPLYLPENDKSYELTLRMEDGCPMVDNNDNNKALSAFNHILYVRSRAYWMEGAKWNEEQILAYLKGYQTAADSLIAIYHCAEPVSEYLHLWAYLQNFNEFASLPQATKRKHNELSFSISDLLEHPSKVLDVPMAEHFSLSAYAIYRSLPPGSYEQRLESLNSGFKNEALREKVTAMLAGEKKKGPKKGTPFPANAKIVDCEGKEVSMEQFKGKYVYIDLWASWCSPCVKEIPWLQKLEKELENPDVVFVSISVDKNETAWKNKMAALEVDGNQFLNADNSIADSLNVKGIPYFVIYDKEGNLLVPNAPRPSSAEIKELLERLH